MYEAGKRAFDLSIALIGLVLLAPVLLVVAIGIKLDAPGPVFYLGERVGRYGRKFKIYKFRTMRVNAEALGTTTAKADPRITRLGHYLRRYKIDELPQLLNVIRGEMSLVGPRPEVEEHTRAYTAEERLILTVLPGITDYSSIHFFNLGEVLGSTNAHEVFLTTYRSQKNQLRLRYVRNRSFAEDLRIIGLTLLTLLRAVVRPARG